MNFCSRGIARRPFIRGVASRPGFEGATVASLVAGGGVPAGFAWLFDAEGFPLYDAEGVRLYGAI